jgi:TonB-linked SusC/RagA family outer membrane protein
MRKLLLLPFLLFSFFDLAFGQARVITGKIVNKQGQAVPFATVRVKGTKESVGADADGNFTVKANTGDVLIVTATDILPLQVPVGDASTISIPVTEKVGNLSEVVITAALGIKRQARELGYATAAVNTKQLNQAAVTNAATGLAAKVSGVDIRLSDNSVDPQVKVTFRGSRSIEGSNAALIIVDGVPVDQTYLANLNPSDIEDVTILKGSNAAALYGMAASNGVLLMTTKKGKGQFALTYQNTVSFESISYFPALQNEYSGWGGEPPGNWPNPSTGGIIQYVDPFSGMANTVPYENEGYGAAYSSKDFHLDSIPIGQYANQQWKFIPYQDVPNGRKDFFQTGVGDQNKLSGSFGGKLGGLYFSGERTTKQGVVPNDRYTRTGGRINGNLNLGRLSISGGVSYNNTSTNVAGNSYIQNRPVYYNVINQLPSVDLKTVKDVSQFVYNQGYVDAYYPNPWWQIFNSRAKRSTDQLLSNLQLSYKINDWLSVTARQGYSRTSIDAPAYIDSISFPSWMSVNGGPWGFSNLSIYPGNVGLQKENVQAHYDDLNGDLFFIASKRANKFKFNLIVGGNYRSRSSYGYWYSNQVNSGGNLLGANVIPPFYTKVNNVDGSAYATFNYKRNDQSLYGDFTVGYDDWLFLHGSFRNDWTSILDPQHRSFSYPGVDMSAVVSDKLGFLKESNTISFLKLRVGYAGTGNVSLEGFRTLGVMGNITGGTAAGGFSVIIPNYGAYAIYPVATVGTGFPFGNLSGYSQNVSVVQNGLKPEKTRALEFGFQLGLFGNRVNLEANYYDQNASNQTIPLQTSTAAGINSYLTNAGEIDNNGVELDLSLTPLIRIGDFKFDLSANFSYQNSKVVSIAGGQAELDQINFGQVSLGGIYAIQGKAYSQILTTDFNRDPLGRIIVNASTGLPSFNPNLIDAGNTNYKYFAGISPSLSYKSLTLKAVFDYRGGAKILNEEGNVMDFSGISTNDAQNRQAFVIPNSVIQTGPGKYTPNNNVPITSGFPGLPSSIFWWANYYNQLGMPYVTSAAFIKLREVSLSYEFPSKVFGTQKVFRGLSLALIGRNLFMWRPKTNVWSDPEFSTNGIGNAVGYTTEFQTPPTRIISISLTAKIL